VSCRRATPGQPNHEKLTQRQATGQQP
jgi:hypothetical protein